MDNEVVVTFIFHAMGDDVREVVKRCMDYFEYSVPHTCDPQEIKIVVTPR